MLTKPILQSINTFDANFNKTLNFKVIGGSQVHAHQVDITSSANVQVYLEKKTSFLFSHELPALTLINGTEYKARIRTFDISDVASDWSDWVIFYVYTTPSVSITNFSSVIQNQSYTFEGNYNQLESDGLQSYRYILYDDLENIITSSSLKYDGLLTHEIIGLEDQNHYKIELKVISNHGIEGTSGKLNFQASYFQPRLATVLNCENNDINGTVEIIANIIRIVGTSENSPVYIDDEWIDATENLITFDEGFNVHKDFSLEMWLKDIQENEPFLYIYGSEGKFIVNYTNNKIRVLKQLNNAKAIYAIFASEDITILPSDIVYICLKHYFNLVDVNAEIVVE